MKPKKSKILVNYKKTIYRLKNIVDCSKIGTDDKK